MLHLTTTAVVLSCYLTAVAALAILPVQIEFPFQDPHQLPFHLPPPQAAGSHRVAIIGSGAAGSATAYFLRHFANQNSSLYFDVTVYEKAAIGDRSTTVRPWQDDPYDNVPHDEEEERPVELGASSFIAMDRNLMKAAREFNLTLESPLSLGDQPVIWDGETVVYTSRMKRWWRYGYRSLSLADALVANVLVSLRAIYSRQFTSLGPFVTLSSFADAANLTSLLSTSTRDHFVGEGVGSLYVEEVIGAASRVNYGQDVDSIHALGGLVSMIAQEGAFSVVGGNRQIFEQFVERSKAKIRLSDVRQLIRVDAESQRQSEWIVKAVESTGELTSEVYDTIILATPFHQSGIELINSQSDRQIPRQDYVHLHVTFVLTNATSPASAFFGSTSSISTTIHSTFSTASSQKPIFNSLNYQKRLLPSTALSYLNRTDSIYLVKLTSDTILSSESLESIFGLSNVVKVVRNEWDAYPTLKPMVGEDKSSFAPVRLESGLYYVNGFERVISTMEAETIAAFNVVSLVLREVYQYIVEKSWADWDEE